MYRNTNFLSGYKKRNKREMRYNAVIINGHFSFQVRVDPFCWSRTRNDAYICIAVVPMWCICEDDGASLKAVCRTLKSTVERPYAWLLPLSFQMMPAILNKRVSRRAAAPAIGTLLDGELGRTWPLYSASDLGPLEAATCALLCKKLPRFLSGSILFRNTIPDSTSKPFYMYLAGKMFY